MAYATYILKLNQNPLFLYQYKAVNFAQ